MASLRFFALLLVVWALLFSSEVSAQGHKITGRIVDSETLDPLPYAHVFIDQTTLGGVSDINGEYVIENLENGDYKLVFSFVGYELFYKTVTVNGADVRASVRMLPQLEMLQAVEVKGSKDKEWEAQLKKFNRVFFGETEWAKDCKILNPWALDFSYDSFEKKFTAKAAEPLQIENKALGYNVTCNLQLFSFDKTSYKIKGLYKFEEVNTLDPREAARWTRNRKLAYQNSLRFLMKSIVDEHERQNGFNLYLDNRPAKYVSQTGYFAFELEKNLEVLDAHSRLTIAGKPGLYKLSLDKRIEVHHTTLYARHKSYRDVTHPVSWIETDKGYILLSSDGHIQNNDQIITSGEFNNFRIAGMLPQNYSPGSFVVVNYLTKRNQAKRLQERAYLQPDKTTYYPGEKVWFKAHTNYANPSLRDSLSRVLYVDLISDKDSILYTTMVKIDTLGAEGNLALNPNWPSGNYRMRAYTRWMQNYGPDAIQYTPIRILPPNKKFIVKDELPLLDVGDFDIVKSIESEDSLVYYVSLDSTKFSGWSSCAVSMAPVTAGSLAQAKLFQASMFFPDDLPDGTLGDFVFPLETGFSLQAKVVHPKKKPSRLNMTIIKGLMDTVYTFKSDRHGAFELTDLDFFDTIKFSFQARDKKGRIFGSTILLPNSKPAVPSFKLSHYPVFDTIDLEAPVQLVRPKVDSVVATTKPVEENSIDTYYNADYVLQEKELSSIPGSLSIIMALQGRVPGLQYNAENRTLSFRGNKVGTQGGGQPLIVLDGIPMYQAQGSKDQQLMQPQDSKQESVATSDNYQQSSQQSYAMNQNPNQVNQQVQINAQDVAASTAFDMISHLTVSSISRVEINSRMDPRYGSLGANGVISIYTKKVQNGREPIKTMDFYPIQGFQRPEKFSIAINYSPSSTSVQQYHPTLYWNPNLIVRPAGPSRIILPQPQSTEIYRVTIAGVTQGGVPVFSEFYVNPKKEKPLSASLDLRQK